MVEGQMVEGQIVEDQMEEGQTEEVQLVRFVDVPSGSKAAFPPTSTWRTAGQERASPTQRARSS